MMLSVFVRNPKTASQSRLSVVVLKFVLKRMWSFKQDRQLLGGGTIEKGIRERTQKLRERQRERGRERERWTRTQSSLDGRGQ